MRRNTHGFVKIGLSIFAGGARQTVEVVAQDFAGQENRRDAEPTTLDRGGNEVLVSFIRPGLGDISDGYLVIATVHARSRGLCDVNLCSCSAFSGNWERHLVPDLDMVGERT